MIQLEKVSISYESKTVLSDFSLSLPTGKCTALLGASGSGKTTVLRLLAGLCKPDAGSVLGTEDVKFSFVFQEDRLLPFRTVTDNLLFVGASARQAEAALGMVGLTGEGNAFPSSLSGGMKRRLALARALCCPDADCYLLDEPLTGQDPATEEALLRMLKEQLQGKTVLLITHSEAQAAFLADNIVHMA